MPRKQNERDLVRRPCIRLLRSYRCYGLLDRYQFFYWSCPPDLGVVTDREKSRYKADGYEKGVFDLAITAANPNELRQVLCEFKYGSNGYTKEQRGVAQAAKETPVETIIIKSIDEFKDFIDENFTTRGARSEKNV